MSEKLSQAQKSRKIAERAVEMILKERLKEEIDQKVFSGAFEANRKVRLGDTQTSVDVVELMMFARRLESIAKDIVAARYQAEAELDSRTPAVQQSAFATVSAA